MRADIHRGVDQRPSGAGSADARLGFLLPLQFAIVAVLLLALAFAPPAHGSFLLVPLFPHAGERIAADAVARGGQLLAPGPIAGSLVVRGDRDVVTRGFFQRGVVTLAAPDFLCGAL